MLLQFDTANGDTHRVSCAQVIDIISSDGNVYVVTTGVERPLANVNSAVDRAPPSVCKIATGDVLRVLSAWMQYHEYDPVLQQAEMSRQAAMLPKES
jgi:hypothetical protein